MSADVLHEVLGELGRGDEVAVAERLKANADGLVSRLGNLPGDDRELTPERVAELLAATSDACEGFLMVALPAIEYSDGIALRQLPRSLGYITRATAAASTHQTARLIAGVPAVGRIVWALTTFALHCDRLQALVALAAARVDVPFEDDTRPVLALTSLRYPDALDRSALNSFRNYREWLAALGLLDHHPFFRQDLEPAFSEGDLVLAIYTGQFRDRIYAVGCDRATVRRFLARVADPVQRVALEQLFVGEGSLEERLEHAYATVAGDQNSFEHGPAHLFATSA